MIRIIPVIQDTITNALISGFTDFKGRVLAESAAQAGADYIISRDKNGFAEAVIFPKDFLTLLEPEK